MLFRTLAATAFLTLAATAAQAGLPDTASTQVTFGDLNLSHAADAKILAGRLQAAAKSVCASVNPDLEPSEMQECMSAAISMAIARIEGHLDKTVRTSLDADQAVIENP